MVEGVAPKGTVTEAFAWLATAIAVGSALGAAGAGALADQAGPTAAYLLGAGATALAALIALARTATTPTTATRVAGRRRLTRGDRRARQLLKRGNVDRPRALPVWVSDGNDHNL
jgi:MFS family permease